MIDLADDRRKIEAHLAEVSDEEFEAELEEAGMAKETCGNCRIPDTTSGQLICLGEVMAADNPGCSNWAPKKVDAQTCGNCGHGLPAVRRMVLCCLDAVEKLPDEGACNAWIAKEALKPPLTPACERCAFSAKYDRMPESDTLQCHRYAPKPYFNESDDSAARWSWPLVWSSEWCGEYKARS